MMGGVGRLLLREVTRILVPWDEGLPDCKGIHNVGSNGRHKRNDLRLITSYHFLRPIPEP